MIFLDSSYLIANKIEDDENHLKAIKISVPIVQGKYGEGIVNDYIFDEVVTVTLNKTKKLNCAIEVGNEVKNSCKIIKVDKEIFDSAWKIFKEQKNTMFSFIDCSILALMKFRGIKDIATFDKEFLKAEGINVII
jgi:predicted nucleic acid-binding protein